jgi:hypothetical protein
MSCQLSLELAVMRCRLGQFFQHAGQRRGLGDNSGFAGAVLGQHQGLDECRGSLVAVTVLYIGLSQGHVKISQLAVFEIQPSSGRINGGRVVGERQSEAAQ